jgi:cation diffusion facilitator family transporter
LHTKNIAKWNHDHIFGLDRKQAGERRTVIVISITFVAMVIEIVSGVVFGSMALLADGIHMASHASALAISAFAYYYTRRHAKDNRFNFGTGKVNSLAAFASAILLVLIALVMAWESTKRIIIPVTIEFNQAILVAVFGILVNGICLLILGGHGHSHNHESKQEDHPDHTHDSDSHDHHHHQDHNLWAAYIHVLADALTSFLAIFALLAGKYFDQRWLDPLMGILGAALVMRWSWGLLHASTHVLLDMQVPENLCRKIREAIEAVGDNRISDLHIWSVGPGIYAAEIAIVSSVPLEVKAYHHFLPASLGLVHVTFEIHRCNEDTSKL